MPTIGQFTNIHLVIKKGGPADRGLRTHSNSFVATRQERAKSMGLDARDMV